ncbi:hypothetical protein ABL78_3863 [Leptomonas seymouri]|uniref:Uncharacterized protein n=1 Tax=Leptomonas seymouri TaxID=5684 RepID=A0A0N1PEF4_LEPSE|nr:hypothetical protein ABL78_3863 [Leptomonas seymouri]|eukprot:KPI87051.1 hypothetical protein ABL78_3863 [Leptomonas seymouri]
MLFRSRRSNNGGLASPSSSSTFAATVGNFSLGGPTGYERPSSAPVAGAVPLQPSGNEAVFVSVKPDEVQNVEDRLNIIKRSRTVSSAKQLAARESDSSAMGFRSSVLDPRSVDPPTSELGGEAAAAVPNTGLTPPHRMYPTFSLAKLPKHEQHVMDALLREFTEVLFFPKNEGY